ncbi:hypothetical protein E1B28_003458 [Marasmius oreades]|uniref:Uncharacterized protein n=1 Tax=Marasmius oreades TaxID=181124 RepID=A0A9P7RM93_9AGAR|nr:uncharacterized protein E1B28_003458 [Marasmius oreades]KAG7085927.1 hypothetical protein E1B28_003458 [Marasmius oreades]
MGGHAYYSLADFVLCCVQIWIRYRRLCQSCSTLSTLKIRKDEWPDSALIDSIYLDLLPIFDCRRDAELNPIPLDMVDIETPYYLFPDPDGQSVIPESRRISLGLPSFGPWVSPVYYIWNTETYDVIRAWQEARGFDPLTTEFARSLGYPIMDPIFPDPMNSLKTLVSLLPSARAKVLWM